MYKIGEVSKLTKISARMLRYYDKENILKPSHIAENSYRYYTDEDLYLLSRIKNLRKFEFAYEEIKDILEKNTYENVDIYINKIEELKNNVKKYGDLILEIEEKTKIKDRNIIINNYDINIGERQTVKILCKRTIINCDDIENFIDISNDIISKKDVIKLGCYYVMFYNNEDLDENEFEVEYCQPIVNSKEINGFDIKIVENSTYISTIHYGDYEQLNNAYNALFKWARINRFEIKGNFIEKYFIDSSLSVSSHEFITEVSVNVLKI